MTIVFHTTYYIITNVKNTLKSKKYFIIYIYMFIRFMCIYNLYVYFTYNYA